MVLPGRVTVIAEPIVAPPTNIPTTAPVTRKIPARRYGTPIMSRVPHPGHRPALAAIGREQTGQPMTERSGAPISRVESDSSRSLDLPRSAFRAIVPGVYGEGRRDGTGTMVPSIDQDPPLEPAGDTGRVRVELTRRADYAVRAMLALAAPDAGPRLSARSIATSMAIPPRFLPQILRELADSGLVEAQTGRNGGYRLARPARDISLLDIVDAVEPTPRTRVCVLRGGPCGLDGHCAVHDVFADAQEAVTTRLGRASLAELALALAPQVPRSGRDGASHRPRGPRAG